jgi:hypothetical protein
MMRNEELKILGEEYRPELRRNRNGLKGMRPG